jgi:hypothetical protein
MKKIILLIMGITLSTTAFTSINSVKNDNSAQSQLQKINSNDNCLVWVRYPKFCK